ncbi:hypothetical protein CH373_06120 [Leptospira perolatii]|uniref:YARHG domain-containing protein n=1 Tax=Leptospira perolatii TaxID=2023191 RepID=A0A2M9ZP39_9LEPT|nr:YARHG domain-containing protein [Leptospira perolatii]PJZ70843.1 hypothetical protein CH360_04850 [Leptospira perolatii]PJZ73739.1 hypothetical protein CH373_06120 [Leptospira perolatii]
MKYIEISAVATVLALLISACQSRTPQEIASAVIDRCDRSAISKPFRKEDLLGISKHKVILIKNTIVAQYGREFKTPYIREHFQKCTWYKPQHAEVSSMLNETDKANLALLESIEDSLPENEAIPLSADRFTGIFLRTTPGDLGYPIFLCPNGVYLEPSMCRPGYQRGEWKYVPGDLTFIISIECTSTDEGIPSVPPSGCDKVFPKHSFSGCRRLAHFKVNHIKADSNAEYFLYIFGNPRSGSGPSIDLKQCAPDFKPKTLDDLQLSGQ